MARFWRRRRWPHRRRWYKTWRRGRSYRFRHWGHRWRRRRRPFRYRTAAVRYHPSRRRKTLVVRGWEPLGNVCENTLASKEAKPYELLDKDFKEAKNANCETSTWEGSWGHHYFTFELLMRRASIYFASFSSDWRSYDYLQFLGGYIWLPRQYYLDYMFYIDYDLKTSSTDQMYKNPKTWFHPGILLNRPGAHIIGSPHRLGLHSGFKKIRVKPPSNWEGLYNIPDAIKYIFVHWAWTWIDLELSFMDSYCVRLASLGGGDKVCQMDPWFSGCKVHNAVIKDDSNKDTDPRAGWVDRTQYAMPPANCSSIDTERIKHWGPFCPAKIGLRAPSERSVWFKYKFFFKLSGESVYRALPSPAGSDLVPPAPSANIGNGHKVPSKPILKRPSTEADILPGDLDADGILTDRALERITGSSTGRQPTLLVPKRVRFRLSRHQRQRRISSLLRRILER
nr:ORF1 [Torque teno Leptonychotes weddellii virus 2]